MPRPGTTPPAQTERIVISAGKAMGPWGRRFARVGLVVLGLASAAMVLLPAVAPFLTLTRGDFGPRDWAGAAVFWPLPVAGGFVFLLKGLCVLISAFLPDLGAWDDLVLDPAAGILWRGNNDALGDPLAWKNHGRRRGWRLGDIMAVDTAPSGGDGPSSVELRLWARAEPHWHAISLPHGERKAPEACTLLCDTLAVHGRHPDANRAPVAAASPHLSLPQHIRFTGSPGLRARWPGPVACAFVLGGAVSAAAFAIPIIAQDLRSVALGYRSWADLPGELIFGLLLWLAATILLPVIIWVTPTATAIAMDRPSRQLTVTFITPFGGLRDCALSPFWTVASTLDWGHGQDGIWAPNAMTLTYRLTTGRWWQMRRFRLPLPPGAPAEEWRTALAAALVAGGWSPTPAHPPK